MRESLIELRVRERAEELGWQVHKIRSLSKRGFPDRLFFRKGFLFFVEFKREGEEPRKQQMRRIEELLDEDIEVYVIDSIEQGYDILNKYENY
jgi:hypothetical protein